MKRKYLLYSLIAGAFTLTGCNDAFLERAPQTLNDETFWTTPNDLKTYATAFYGILPSGVANIDDQNSDDMVPRNVNQFIWDQYSVPAEDGEWSKSDWQNIRNINYFMTHYQTVEGSEAEINRYVGEMRFFRALEYFSKIKTFGDVPWLEEDLNVDDTDILYGPKMPRNQVAQKIIEDLDFAIQWLPDGRVTSTGDDANRITKDVARHVKARVCLHEGTYYKYHSELGYDYTDLLTKAAEEANTLMASGRYSIYKDGDPAHDYYNMFVMEDKSNLSEAILYIDYVNPLRRHNMGHGAYEALAGFSKDFVDGYLYVDGLPKALTSYPTADETMAEELANRDPRASQTIRNDKFFEGNESYTVIVTKDTLGADDAYITQFIPTGYQTIKGYDPATAHRGNTLEVHDGIAYRYAETLLIYAEAKAELGSITQDDLDRSINQLRDRVGMPHLTTSVNFTDPNWPDYGYTLSPLLQEIRRERRVELAGEGFRFADICRWKAGQILNNVMTYVGKKISVKASQAKDGLRANNGCVIIYGNYTNADLSYQAGKSRTWNDKMYLYPIPTGELQRNPQLEPQNPGW